MINIWVVLLFLTFLVVLIAPLIPAGIELYRHRKVRLLIAQDRDDNPRFFTDRFISHLINDFGPINEQYLLWRGQDNCVIHHKKYLIIGGRQRPDWQEWQNMANSRQFITILGGSTQLPNHSVWLRDIFSPFETEVGTQTTLRAIRSEGSLRLHTGCTVIRWIDAQELHIDEACHLSGRATAKVRMILGPAVRFQRLFAPCIAVDGGSYTPPTPGPSAFQWNTRQLNINTDLLAYMNPGHNGHNASERYTSVGDIYIPPNSTLKCDIVCGGVLRIGRGSRIIGQIKAHGNIECQADVYIEGTLISQDSIELDGHCTISQIALADKNIILGEYCSVGQENILGSLCASTVTLGRGNIVYGSIVARQGGQTLPAPEHIGQQPSPDGKHSRPVSQEQEMP